MKHSSSKTKRLFLISAVVLVVAVIVGFAVLPLAEEKADYSQLVGRWVRASGGYVLDIQMSRPTARLKQPI